jgi:hypothetical protein
MGPWKPGIEPGSGAIKIEARQADCPALCKRWGVFYPLVGHPFEKLCPWKKEGGLSIVNQEAQFEGGVYFTNKACAGPFSRQPYV